MLVLAANYTDEILELIRYSVKNAKDYKYYHTTGYVDFEVNKETNTWNCLEMVPLHEDIDGYSLNAYFKASFSRGVNSA